MLFGFLSLLSFARALKYLEAENNVDAYQVLIYFWPEIYEVFGFDNNLLAPGCVLALEKLESQWQFSKTLGKELSYKKVDCSIWAVSETMDFIESQLVTKRYSIPNRVTSELSLILGPIGTMVFVKPYCYQTRYNCIFGIGKITSASIAAVSEDLRTVYSENFQITNNIFLDNIKDSPHPILGGLFREYDWNFRHIVIFSESFESGDQANSLILTLESELISHNITFVKDYNYTDARNVLFSTVPYVARGLLIIFSFLKV